MRTHAHTACALALSALSVTSAMAQKTASQSIDEYRAMLANNRALHAHQPGKRLVHMAIHIPRKRERQRRGHARIALDDVGVVPDDDIITIRRLRQRRDRPRLQHVQSTPIERPLDILRRAEMLCCPPRHHLIRSPKKLHA